MGKVKNELGKFASERILVREFDWGELVFYDKYSIYAEMPHFTVIFHRWLTPIGFYASNWTKFRIRARTYKHIDIYTLYELADEFDICHELSGRKADIATKKIVRTK